MINALTIKNLSSQNTSETQLDEFDQQLTNAEHETEFETLIVEQPLADSKLTGNDLSANSTIANNRPFISEQSLQPTNNSLLASEQSPQQTNFPRVLDTPLAQQSKMLALAMSGSLNTEAVGSEQSLDKPVTKNTFEQVKVSISTDLGIEVVNKQFPKKNADPSAVVLSSLQLNQLNQLKVSDNIQRNKLQPFVSLNANVVPPLASGAKLQPNRLFTNSSETGQVTFTNTAFTLLPVGMELQPRSEPINRSDAGLMHFPLDVANFNSSLSLPTVPVMSMQKESDYPMAGLTIPDKASVNKVSYVSNNEMFTNKLVRTEHSPQLLQIANNGQFNEVKIKDNLLGEIHFSVSGKQAEQLGVFALQPHSQLIIQQHLIELRAELSDTGLTDLELFSSAEQQEQNKQRYLEQQANNFADIEEQLITDNEQPNTSAQQRSFTPQSSLNISV